jgi:hypothetical protein
VASAGGGRRRPRGRQRPQQGGKTEGESRGSQPRAHLGPESLVEAAPRRRAEADYGGWWWWCLEAWEAGTFGWAVRGEVESRAGPFIGAGRSVRAGIFLSTRSFDGWQWRWKYPGVDPSGEVLGRDSRRGVNAALWDGTGGLRHDGGRRRVAAAVLGGGDGSAERRGGRRASGSGLVACTSD